MFLASMFMITNTRNNPNTHKQDNHNYILVHSHNEILAEWLNTVENYTVENDWSIFLHLGNLKWISVALWEKKKVSPKTHTVCYAFKTKKNKGFKTVPLASNIVFLNFASCSVDFFFHLGTYTMR